MCYSQLTPDFADKTVRQGIVDPSLQLSTRTVVDQIMEDLSDFVSRVLTDSVPLSC